MLPDFNHSFLPVLNDALEKYADRVCIKFAGESYTYQDVDYLSAQVANALVRDGFEPGMHGAVYSLNSAEGLIVTLGIIRAGGVWIPINPRNSVADNVQCMLQFGCQALFFQDVFQQPIEQFMERSEGDSLAVCLDRAGESDDWRGWSNGMAEKAPVIERSGDSILTIPQTGGTTGAPKGVSLTHSNFCAYAYGFSHTRQQQDDKPSVWLGAAPMTHVGGRIALSVLPMGATFVIMEKVDLQLILESVEKEKITDFFLPPTAIYGLIEQPNLADFDLSSLRSLGYGSAPMSLDKLKEALIKLGPVMGGGFGQTECPMFISRLEPSDHYIDGEIAPDKRLSSVGRATVLSTLAILDDEGTELPAGELGEIAVKGPGVSLGYYNNPEETAKIRLNGWHLTGDIGYLDDEGFLYIVDRIKDMIITGGFNVYSAEVESALMSMPGIRVAVVFGIPSEKWGEEVMALVQLEEHAEGEVDLTREQIIQFAKERLGGVKSPKRVEFVEDLPHTANNKIDKKALKAPYWQGQDRNI